MVSSYFCGNGIATGVGAVTWGNGNNGISGIINTSNSFFGNSQDDQIGRILVPLANGNYVMGSSWWDNGILENAGAIAWADGTQGKVGLVNEHNSLIGKTYNASIGISGITQLTNGNYIINNLSIPTSGGSVTFGNGTEEIKNPINSKNSIFGFIYNPFANNYTVEEKVISLPDGNYIIQSLKFDKGGLSDVGAIIFGNGITGTLGCVNPCNSVSGNIADEGSSLTWKYNQNQGILIVGKPKENIISIFNTSQINNCNSSNSLSITPQNSIICPNSTLELSVSGCDGPVKWSNSLSQIGTTNTIQVSPNLPSTYIVNCNNGTSTFVDVDIALPYVSVEKDIFSGNYLKKAVNEVESDRKIGNNIITPKPTVKFEAGKSILLKPGFVVESLSVFKAEIKTCE